MAKGKTAAEMRAISKNTQFKKGDGRSAEMAKRGAATRRACSVLKSSDAILQADNDGTLQNVVANILNALDKLYKKGSYDAYIKHSVSLLEIVNGRQINIAANVTEKRPINIIFRRATPDDAK